VLVSKASAAKRVTHADRGYGTNSMTGQQSNGRTAGETAVQEITGDKSSDDTAERDLTTLRGDYAAVSECAKQQLEVWFLEKRLCGALWVARIRNDNIELFLAVCEEFEAVTHVDRDFGVFEAYRHAREELFRQPDHRFVDITENGGFDGFVFDNFAEDTTVAAADDEDFLWVGMCVHGEVGDHFLVAVEGIGSATRIQRAAVPLTNPVGFKEL